ncbi:hypothetical protein AGABI2DRAFT_180977 [Agaricus bisporus var. bisporus H97]|uniref:hypothetical protein n=1 Tax=Agaricus bisporus var. bisporus (strain H97 / ATCC MYA-4626 / FGSC 10389) TaxID=936046 RepID=UPI00029F735F|nr:hypothetical protein AGABI2DRAFT_180977 [Agaricus bisporus var. bisporus H97]EKV43307.1 hypothetical protein AGABI2DRAFT_180977 [Agaricus bisporus var. bisporus H97]
MQVVKKSLRFVVPPLAVGMVIGATCDFIMDYNDPEPVHYSPQLAPTAVFVGGTAGIGRAMVENFGNRTLGDANIVIIGRNRAAAEEIIAQLPKSKDPNVKHEFVQCDVSRMKNVRDATQQVLSRHPKINFLVLTAGLMSTKGRNETEEGLDVKLAVHYYSRWAFIKGFMPALEKAIEGKEDGKVISVLAAGEGQGRIDMTDLGLARTFSLSRAASHAATYNDLMVDEFASRHPGLTFIHAYPGFVRTNLLSSSDSSALQIAGPVLNYLLSPLMLRPNRCATRMWAGVFNHTGGAHQLSSLGRGLETPFHGTLDQRQKLWAHTAQITGVTSK